jgi:hypothetical protein
MESKHYRHRLKKIVELDAIQFDGTKENVEYIDEEFGAVVVSIKFDKVSKTCIIHRPIGNPLTADSGDYIVRNDVDAVYPIPKESFEEGFEEYNGT